MALTEVGIEIDGYWCNVFCAYTPWRAGNRWEPDDGEFYVEKVYVDNELRDDLLELIDDQLENRIYALCERGELI